MILDPRYLGYRIQKGAKMPRWLIPDVESLFSDFDIDREIYIFIVEERIVAGGEGFF